MRNKEPLTKEEIKINRVGGYLEETLTGLISYLDRIDQYALEPLSKLGFTSDLETYLYWAHKNPFAVTKGYVSKEIDKIANVFQVPKEYINICNFCFKCICCFAT